MGTLKRKPWICCEQECGICHGVRDEKVIDVPADCQFAILHGLDLREPGLLERPRRSGKSHNLAECADKMVAAGAKVVVVCLNQAMGEYFEKLMAAKFGHCCLVKTKGNFPRWMKGDTKGFYVLTDELLPAEVAELRLDEKGLEFVLGYYSER